MLCVTVLAYEGQALCCIGTTETEQVLPAAGAVLLEDLSNLFDGMQSCYG